VTYFGWFLVSYWSLPINVRWGVCQHWSYYWLLSATRIHFHQQEIHLHCWSHLFVVNGALSYTDFMWLFTVYLEGCCILHDLNRIGWVGPHDCVEDASFPLTSVLVFQLPWVSLFRLFCVFSGRCCFWESWESCIYSRSFLSTPSWKLWWDLHPNEWNCHQQCQQPTHWWCDDLTFSCAHWVLEWGH